MPALEDDEPSPSQRRALALVAFAALVALVWLSVPVASGLFLGAVLAFSLFGVYARLARRLRSPALAAVLLSVGSGLVLVGVLGVLLSFVIDRGVTISGQLVRGLQPGAELRATVDHFEAAAHRSPLGAVDVAGRAQDLAAALGSKLTAWAGAIAGATLKALLVLFFTIMTCFFVLRRWTDVVARIERLLPLHPRHTRAALLQFQRVGKEVFVGTLLTGLAQGLLAGVGYALAGVPEAALLGALTAIASLFPVVGTLLVWVPIAVVLVVSGHTASGVFVLAWGALVVGVVVDYVLRPRLIGRGRQLPSLVTFVSLFGGVAVFGLVGLVLGPVIASVSFALLRTYDEELGRAAAAP